MAKLKPRRRGKSPGDQPGSYQVFVSHATADKWIARVICEKLEAVGAKTFRDDRDIKSGDDIPEEIHRQIRRSNELLVLLTPQSVERRWVTLEIGMALGMSKRKRIVVVLYHVEVDPIPGMLKSKKAISLNDIDTYFAEVSSRVKEQRP